MGASQHFGRLRYRHYGADQRVAGKFGIQSYIPDRRIFGIGLGNILDLGAEFNYSAAEDDSRRRYFERPWPS